MALRRIKSEAEIQARQKKIQIAVGVFMAVLMIVSTAGYAIWGRDTGSNLPTTRFEGRTYIAQGNYLILELNNRPFYFFHLPNKSRGLTEGFFSFSEFTDRPLYVVNPSYAMEPLLINLQAHFTRWQEACFDEFCESDAPLKDCSDNLIVFVQDSEENTRVEKQENCFFLYGDHERAVDAISYRLLGIA